MCLVLEASKAENQQAAFEETPNGVHQRDWDCCPFDHRHRSGCLAGLAQSIELVRTQYCAWSLKSPVADAGSTVDNAHSSYVIGCPLGIRIRALAAAIVGFIGTAVYVGAIVNQGEVEVVPLLAWAGVMGGASLIALTGSLVKQGQTARRLLSVSATVFGIVGFLALFSIGLVFVVAAGLSVWAAVTVGAASN